MGGGSRRRLRAATVALAPALLVLGVVTACKPISKEQWAPGDQSKSGTTSSGSGSGSGTSGSSGSSSTATARTTVQVSGNDLGITVGSGAGSRSSSTSTVVITAPPGTCWQVVLDGRVNRGCGNAEFTDTRGTAAARITKTSGSGTISVALASQGQTVDSGTVSGTNRYVTVMRSEAR